MSASTSVYPPAPDGARMRGVVWCGLADDDGKRTGRRFGVAKVFADLSGKAHLIYEGPIRDVKEPELETDFRAACAHYGIATSDKPMNLGRSRSGGCR